MLFTAPLFAFFFLPATALLYFAFAKRHKRLVLAVICVAFHLLLNLHHPYLLLFLPAILLYTWLGGMAVMRYRRSWLVFIVCVLPYIGLIVLRNLADAAGGAPIYPVGMTVAAMSSTSYLVEAVRGNIKKRNNPFDLALYLWFFPMMPVGPLIKYPDFLRLTQEENIDPSVSNMAEGAMLFATGFIKRIAIGAALVDIYERLLSHFAATHNVMLGVTLLILIYFGIYFSVTGYADMGCGVARMYGIRLSHMQSNPFRAALPDEYSSNLFFGLGAWLEDYVERPLLRMSGGRFVHLIHGLAFGGCLLLIVRPTLYILLLAVPSVGIEYLCSRLQLRKKLVKRSGLRLLFTLITIPVVALGWVFITMGDVATFVEYLTKLTSSGAEYYTDLILIAFSGERYLVLIIMSVLLLLPTLGWHRVWRRIPRTWQTTCEIVYMLAILLLFGFAILFFLPQYGVYHTVPFRFVYV